MTPSRVPVTLVGEPTNPVVAEVFARLAKGSVGVVNIHRTLANSPDVFAAFIGLAHALRFQTRIDAAPRELAILRVLALHHGEYEIAHHRKLARAAGATDAQIAAATATTEAAEPSTAAFDAPTAAVLRFATAFAAGTGVDAETSAALAAHLDSQQIVELTLTLALYLGLAHLTSSIAVPADT